MSDETPKSEFEFDLGDYGGTVSIASGEELLKWAQDEWKAWEWIKGAGQPQLENIVQKHIQFREQLQQQARVWGSVKDNPSGVQNVLASVERLFQEHYCERRIFHNSSVEAAFLSKLREQHGPIAAGGAYMALLGEPLRGTLTHPKLLEGMLEAFLFRREIEWTASAHKEALNALRAEYKANMEEQETGLEELKTRNQQLNGSFEAALKDRAAALGALQTEQQTALVKLHGDQSAEFSKVLSKHEENLKAIEKTYDQKLALQKPVVYWKTKEVYHTKLAKRFGWIAPVVAAGAVGGMGFLVYWIFADLKPAENPKHWQLGILVVGAFFSIWVVRVLVRMLFSHLHLATDAGERRTMILTYLSMSREGAQFAQEDKTLIVQHLFRSASDGYVKDDAAPPSIFDLFTRTK